MKEGMIPRILAKESLNLELRLQRYGKKKFRDLFVISGKWLGVFLEIFLKIRGASYKYVGCGLIFKKMRGLSAKCWEMGFSTNRFVEEKPVGHVRLRFTRDRRHGRPQELTGAQPPATPGLMVIGEGAGEVEEEAVSTFVGSSKLGRWGNGSAAERDGHAAVGAR
jgi:hypothetical protein